MFTKCTLCSFISTAERHFQETLIKEYKDIGFEVPLSPIYDELNDELLKVNIDALYTDLVIIKPEKKEEIRLKSYKDIFRREGRANKTIFLKGEAGVGKSTWCIQLLYAWVKTHEKDFEKAADQKTYSSNLSNDKMRDIEEALSKFDYLFFVPLRCMKGKTIIKDVLFSPLLERLSSLERTVSNVIENCSDKVLILLDGIDEYTEDLSYKGLNQCTVITTTRPWKYDHICATNPRLKVDIVLELKGLDESGITQLAKRVCKAFMESEDSDKSASLPRVSVIVDHVAAFIEHAKHSDLTDTLKVPLTLIILLETYLEQGSFSNSKTSCLVNLLEVLIQRGEQKMLQSDLESSILRKCKDNESQEHNIALFAENEIVSDYTSLLQKLSKLAFNGLSNSCKEEALVFSEKQLGQIFTKDELQLCLKFGLLSRSRYVTSMLSKMKQTVSFYHKLVQEFFAAAWIVSNTEAAEEFKNGITSVDAILEIENVFIFVCGIDAHIGSELSKHFVEVCKSDSISDLTFVNAVFYLNSVFLDKVYELQWSENAITMSRLMLRGQKEVGFSEKPHEPLYVLDMLIFYQMIPQNEDTLIKLVRSSTSCLRRFCLGPECNIFSHNGLRKLIRILEEAVELQEMEMTFQLSTPMDCSLHDDHIQNMCIDFSRHSRLHTVTLRGNLDEHSRVWPCTLFLSALRFLPNLKELRLDGLDEGLCDILVKVIPCLKNLECLTISHDSIFRQSEKTKHQPSCNTGWERFFHSSQTKNLREFHLLNLDTGLAEIDLSQATHLELILIANVKICPVESVKQRESVETNHQSPNKAGWERFFHYLPTKNLHRLLLSNLDIGPAEIDLSQATRLREISINNVKLCPEDGAKQSQPLNNTGWERFFQSLPTKNLLYLRLCNLDIGPAEIDLSQASHLGLFIDNVKLCPKDSARQIASEKTNLPNNTGWERFFNSLPTKTLWQLKLYNLDIGTAIIQIDTNNFLYRISLVDVIMSRKAFDILHSSLKSLSKLELLDIKRVQVNGDIINMNLDNIRK